MMAHNGTRTPNRASACLPEAQVQRQHQHRPCHLHPRGSHEAELQWQRLGARQAQGASRQARRAVGIFPGGVPSCLHPLDECIWAGALRGIERRRHRGDALGATADAAELLGKDELLVGSNDDLHWPAQLVRRHESARLQRKPLGGQTTSALRVQHDALVGVDLAALGPELHGPLHGALRALLPTLKEPDPALQVAPDCREGDPQRHEPARHKGRAAQKHSIHQKVPPTPMVGQEHHGGGGVVQHGMRGRRCGETSTHQARQVLPG
mmetsp:Transcript_44965/g.106889  ORF Transcript_44965/g.106889 Transcript_44965/m.106889 type:complete len:266 (-) Transcript_44965:281-1078(-)